MRPRRARNPHPASSSRVARRLPFTRLQGCRRSDRTPCPQKTVRSTPAPSWSPAHPHQTQLPHFASPGCGEGVKKHADWFCPLAAAVLEIGDHFVVAVLLGLAVQFCHAFLSTKPSSHSRMQLPSGEASFWLLRSRWIPSEVYENLTQPPWLVMPPSTVIFSAVMKLASSDARKRTTLATSLGSPILRIGYACPAASRVVPARSRIPATSGVAIVPGLTEFTRTPLEAYSTPSCRVSERTPPFDRGICWNALLGLASLYGSDVDNRTTAFLQHVG